MLSEYLNMSIKISKCFALASVPEWLEHRPMHQGVSGSIPRQGQVPSLQAPSPVLVEAGAGGNHSMFLSLPPPPSTL